ncbi:MAG TPA: BamA/TamA family outer membrane protein, partial [Rubricoccaceae bacterium]|nr:BamA/TamA family outer membrane protein [Rubricoccaceae bacterium]
ALRARTADVIGSHEGEVFEVVRKGRDTLRLDVHRRKEDGTPGARLWRRTFVRGETEEVRLWGRGGDDRLVVRGEGEDGTIRVRFLAGASRDELADSTGGQQVYAYDTRATEALVVLAKGPRAQIEQSDQLTQAAFGSTLPSTGGTEPILSVQSNVDDGVVIGAGVRVTKTGFPHIPYALRQRIEIRVATTTGAVYGRYDADAPRALGLWDAGVEVRMASARSFRTFFGYGGATERLPSARDDVYRVRMARARVSPYAERNFLERLSARFGPSFEYVRPRRDSTQFNVASSLPARDLRAQLLAGVEGRVTVDATDAPVHASRGVRVEMAARARRGLLEAGHAYTGGEAALSLFATHPNAPWATLATRVGGERLFGVFPFYDAATLGGTTNLRGYRSNRFAGRATFFVNAEPRVRLSRFRAVLWPDGEVGLLGFVDAGRVWADHQAPGPWHVGYGAGGWWTLSNRLGGTATFDVSKETRAFSFRLGFAL